MLDAAQRFEQQHQMMNKLEVKHKSHSIKLPTSQALSFTTPQQDRRPTNAQPVNPQPVLNLHKIQEPLHNLKQTYKADNIYIFQCLSWEGCRGLIMLHHPQCPWPHCRGTNPYYDRSLQISEELDGEVMQ